MHDLQAYRLSNDVKLNNIRTCVQRSDLQDIILPGSMCSFSFSSPSGLSR